MNGGRGVLEQAPRGPSHAEKSTRREADKTDYWHEMARQWERVGPPLRPTAADIGFYTAAIDQWVQTNGPPRGCSKPRTNSAT